MFVADKAEKSVEVMMKQHLQMNDTVNGFVSYNTALLSCFSRQAQHRMVKHRADYLRSPLEPRAT